ncbi:hypothetical protein D0962_37835 [Leptolyngbyaceae cyanobacterium CCMR0082]|uniref:Uncharacterized protein n=1 Tax=Adonisia turfae CCMR0082 TaxID=2304604 RepID=A0A6M0SJ11_9CYAN|nr:hypothetical protein [Adonisia turfae]NEZ68415.1 hypothetical protein [Adonisia turfae CCMR0082]
MTFVFDAEDEHTAIEVTIDCDFEEIGASVGLLQRRHQAMKLAQVKLAEAEKLIKLRVLLVVSLEK